MYRPNPYDIHVCTQVSLSDFQSYLLRLWGLVDDHTLRLIEERYAELDVGGEGILRREHFSQPRGLGRGGAATSGVGSVGSCQHCGCNCASSSVAGENRV